MKKISFFLVTLCLSLSGEAQPVGASGEDPSPSEEFQNSVGVFASSWEGGGLSYQRWIGKIGFAVTAGGMVAPQMEPYGGAAQPVPDFYLWSYNTELDFLWKLFSATPRDWFSSDLYAYFSLSHRGGVDSDSDDGFLIPGDDSTYYWSETAGDYEAVFGVGFGIGFDVVLFNHFSLPLQFGYTVQYPPFMSFCVGGGLRYRF